MDKSKFLKVYSNLPINIRDSVVLVIKRDDREEPITWNVAYLEINNETELGKEIFSKLEKLEII